MAKHDSFLRSNVYVLAPASSEWVPMTRNGVALTKPDDNVPDPFNRVNCYVWDGNDWVPMEPW